MATGMVSLQGSEEFPLMDNNQTSTIPESNKMGTNIIGENDWKPEIEPHRWRIPGQIDQSSQSFGQDIRHVASETYLITGLSFKLLRYLG